MKLYNVYRADINLNPIDYVAITPEKGVHGEIYVCTECRRRAYFRISPKGRKHFYAEHVSTCVNAEHRTIDPITTKTDGKTNVYKLIHKIKSEELKKAPRINKINITVDTDDDDTIPPILRRQNRNIRTASDISLYLDELGVDHRIGAALDNAKLHIPSKDFYADNRSIGRIRENGFRYGVGLALVRPTRPKRFGIELPKEVC